MHVRGRDGVGDPVGCPHVARWQQASTKYEVWRCGCGAGHQQKGRVEVAVQAAAWQNGDAELFTETSRVVAFGFSAADGACEPPVISVPFCPTFWFLARLFLVRGFRLTTRTITNQQHVTRAHIVRSTYDHIGRFIIRRYWDFIQCIPFEMLALDLNQTWPNKHVQICLYSRPFS